MKTLKIAIAMFVLGIASLAGVPDGKAAETIKTGGTFIVGLQGDPVTLNPIVTSSIEPRMVAGNIFSRLLYTDQEGGYHGDLAEKWTVSKDNLRMTFELRKGLKWHDDRPITADDVEFGSNYDR